VVRIGACIDNSIAAFCQNHSTLNIEVNLGQVALVLVLSSLQIFYRLHLSFRMFHFSQFARDLFLRKVLLEFSLWFLASVTTVVIVISMSSSHRQIILSAWIMACALLWATLAVRRRDQLDNEERGQEPELQPTRPQLTDNDLAEVYNLYSVLPLSVEDGDNENEEG
jgi:hypothetical protein